MKKVLLAAATIALAVGLIGIARASSERDEHSASPAQYQVRIDNFTFGPATITVPRGATVTWVNQDDIPHTVVSKDGKDFKSPVLDTDQKFTHSFSRSGAYDYYCSIHPHMTGRVVVQ